MTECKKHRIEFNAEAMQSINDAVAVPHISSIEHNPQFVDVCTFFGAATYQAQLFEGVLAHLLVEFQRLTDASGFEIDSRIGIDNLTKDTLGRLLHKMSDVFEIEPEIATTLQSALKNRNELMHSFFRDRSGDFDDREKVKEMVHRLVADGLLFKKAAFIAFGIRNAVVIQANHAERSV